MSVSGLYAILTRVLAAEARSSVGATTEPAWRSLRLRGKSDVRPSLRREHPAGGHCHDSLREVPLSRS